VIGSGQAKDSEIDSENFGICEPYRGNACEQFIKNMSIFVDSRVGQDAIESKIREAFTVVASSQDVSPQCHRFAIPSLCLSAFPPCDDMASEAKARKVSYEMLCGDIK
jgi:hypothetical protein